MAPTDRVHGVHDFSAENLHDVEGSCCCLDLCVVYSRLLWLRRESQSRRIDGFERSCSPSFFRRELADCSKGAKLRVLETFENRRRKASPLAVVAAASSPPEKIHDGGDTVATAALLKDAFGARLAHRMRKAQD
jgi:hypothetical protein